MTVLSAFPLEILNTDPTRNSEESGKQKRVCRMVHKSRLMLTGLNEGIVSGDRGMKTNLRDSFQDPQGKGQWLQGGGVAGITGF